MLTFIDISNWQAGIDLATVLQSTDALVAKATESTNFVDKYCDGFIQTAIAMVKPFGFYHFARNGDPYDESNFFLEHTEGYYLKGIPILDWEADQSVEWVNTFVRHVHDMKGVWPWIYANPWRFNQGGVEPNCMRWVASYPAVTSPTFADAQGWTPPETDGLVGAWQFCSDGKLPGYSGNLDCNLFYGTRGAWDAYAGIVTSGGNGSGGNGGSDGDTVSDETIVVENDEYKVTVERK